MDIKLDKKFADKNIDSFISEVHRNYVKNPKDDYYFDLTEVEYIGNQELLLLTALFRSFISIGVKFKVCFYNPETKLGDIPPRVQRQIIQIWHVWKIWTIIPPEKYIEYLGIDGKTVDILSEQSGYSPKFSELYTRYGVTPFVALDYFSNYNEVEIQHTIDPIYELNAVITRLLALNDCSHPFTSNSLSSIITEELYLNFLDHSLPSSFNGFGDAAYMSISFQSKLDEEVYSQEEIQRIADLNFNTECLPESKRFYYDDKLKSYKNKPFIQFSFLDFGQGIAETLKSQFFIRNSSKTTFNDSDVISFAFNHDSSRHPFIVDNAEQEKFIPRGLFDVLTVVHRYRGLLVVRSNYGKVIYDFSDGRDPNNAISFFGKQTDYFPGTLLSIYIPAIEKTESISTSSIKPIRTFKKIVQGKIHYLSINTLIDNLKVPKEQLYSRLISDLRNHLQAKVPTLWFISFYGHENIEKRLLKKSLYFFLTDYSLNHHNNVIIINPPSEDLLDEMSNEIALLDQAVKNYKFHPLPFVYSTDDEGVVVRWLGVFNEEDRNKLDALLMEDFSLAKSDFADPTNIAGHLVDFDTHGNLRSNLPVAEQLKKIVETYDYRINQIETQRLLFKYDCISIENPKGLYLCNGNYYQKKFIDLSNLVNDKNDCWRLSNLILQRIRSKITDLTNYTFIGVTNTSYKLFKAMETQGVSKESFIALEKYHSFEQDLVDIIRTSNKKFILICDVISTGYLTKRISKQLEELGGELALIAVVVNTLDSKFDGTQSFIDNFGDRIVSLYQHDIAKYRRTNIRSEIVEKDIIRVNPHTNIPVTLSIGQTQYNESVIFSSSITYNRKLNEIIIDNRFLNTLDEGSIKIGFLRFNNLIHPYFFDTSQMLKTFNEEILVEIFQKINHSGLRSERFNLFYPRKSSIECFDLNLVKKILQNQGIEEIEIERFSTSEGWKFPHSADYFSSKVVDNLCLVLDDGSCSGDSLVQMIDEISFYDAKEIVVVCFIGRITDHKREFFSRLASIKAKDQKTITISIYFVSHWHIPTYYIDENPISKEKHWLKQIVHLQNTPREIKKIASKILTGIEPKTIKDFEDYKYLPRRDDGTIPKKEIILVREELGKVIGYRLYRESFHFFDAFIKKYENLVKSNDRYKEIELLCATLNFEPYLFDKITEVLPDVAEKIEDFVRVLIFSDHTIHQSLSYHWKREDIVHLFFIVFKNEKLASELTTDKFLELITFAQSRESSLNYVLYKLLFYFPLHSSELETKKYDSKPRELIFDISNSNAIHQKTVRKFYNFISTLPSRTEFSAQLNSLRDSYIKQTEAEYHDQKTSLNHNISTILSEIRKCIALSRQKEIPSGNIVSTIRQTWISIVDFLNPILVFASTFNDYLEPYPKFSLYNSIEGREDSVRSLIGYIDDILYASNEITSDIAVLKSVDKAIIRIQSIVETNSTFHKLIAEPTSSIRYFYDGFIAELSEIGSYRVKAPVMEIDSKVHFLVPQLYTDKLIKSELLTNIIKYADDDSDAIIDISFNFLDDYTIEIVLVNSINSTAKAHSNGEGLKCLRLMSDSDHFGFRYQGKEFDNQFRQTLKLQIKR